jgi:hypothetical protein
MRFYSVAFTDANKLDYSCLRVLAKPVMDGRDGRMYNICELFDAVQEPKMLNRPRREALEKLSFNMKAEIRKAYNEVGNTGYLIVWEVR